MTKGIMAAGIDHQEDCRCRDVRKILVLKLRHIGDVLLTVPVFRALKETFPAAQVTALVNSGTDETLRGNPLVDEVISLDRKVKSLFPLRRYQQEIRFLAGIRKMGFDMTVDLTGGDRAAILSITSGANCRLGWKTSRGFIGKRYLYTHQTKPDLSRHMVLQNLDIVRSCGIDTEDTSVTFSLSEADRAFAEKTLLGSTGRPGPVVHVHPTSRWLFKCWKDESMAEVLQWMLDSGITVVLTSSPEPRELARTEKVLSLVGRKAGLIDLSGRTTIKQLGAISEAADVFFGVDSAPMHIAAAVGTPVVALFGPTGANNWGPWDNSCGNTCPYGRGKGLQTTGIHTVIQCDWDCIPCGRDGCGGSKVSRCLEEIGTDEVKDILYKKLKGAMA